MLYISLAVISPSYRRELMKAQRQHQQQHKLPVGVAVSVLKYLKVQRLNICTLTVLSMKKRLGIQQIAHTKLFLIPLLICLQIINFWTCDIVFSHAITTWKQHAQFCLKCVWKRASVIRLVKTTKFFSTKSFLTVFLRLPFFCCVITFPFLKKWTKTAV